MCRIRGTPVFTLWRCGAFYWIVGEVKWQHHYIHRLAVISSESLNRFLFAFIGKLKAKGTEVDVPGTLFRSSLFFPELLVEWTHPCIYSMLKFSVLLFFTRAWIFSSCFRAGVSLPWSPCTVSTSYNESKVTTELFNTAVCPERTAVENNGSVRRVRYYRQFRKVQLYLCRGFCHWGAAWPKSFNAQGLISRDHRFCSNHQLDLFLFHC